MEEKERYTIESFDIYEPSCIFDNKKQQIILTLVEYNYDEIVNLESLLNQQDARIKELEQETYPAYKREHQRRAYLENIEVPKLKERIKELDAEKRFWHSAYQGKQLDYDKLNNDYNKQEKLLSEVLADRSKMQLELDQLKQQLHDLPEKIVEEIKEKFYKIMFDSSTIDEILDTILKKYGG